jgi:DNA-binding transcriptional ArsR family regulator
MASVSTEDERLSDETAERLALLFKAFNDPTRLKILYALMGRELSVGKIAKAVGMSPSAVSHQLSLLRTMRIVKNRREGRTVIYSLDDDHVRFLFEQGLEHVTHD